jgi:hypothetical protein
MSSSGNQARTKRLVSTAQSLPRDSIPGYSITFHSRILSCRSPLYGGVSGQHGHHCDGHSSCQSPIRTIARSEMLLPAPLNSCINKACSHLCVTVPSHQVFPASLGLGTWSYAQWESWHLPAFFWTVGTYRGEDVLVLDGQGLEGPGTGRHWVTWMIWCLRQL